MSVMDHVIAEERDRLARYIKNAEKKIVEQFPKGSVVRKKIDGKVYAYTMERQGKKIVTRYIGVSGSAEEKKHKEKIAERKKLEKQLKEAKENYKKAIKYLK